VTVTAPDLALRQRFLDGMSFAAATVSIVTTDGPAGRYGVTVSAMSSVSADTSRPTMLVCVHELSRTSAAIRQNGVFCVNVLRDDQSAISDAFAGRSKTATVDKFSIAQWTTEATGAPRIIDPLVAFDCRLKEALHQGTHHIFIGEVEAIWREKLGTPLIYANRSYGTISPLSPSTTAASSAGELRLGCLVSLAPYVIPTLVAAFLERQPGTSVRLIETSQAGLAEALRDGQCDLVLTYDLELPQGLAKLPLTRIPTYALLPSAHPLAAAEAVSLSALAKEPMILLDLPMSREHFMSVFSRAGLTPNVRLRSSNFETVRGLVGHGLGFALLGTKPATGVTYDGHAVTARPILEPTQDSTIVMAERADAPASAAKTILKEICGNLFRLKADGLTATNGIDQQ